MIKKKILKKKKKNAMIGVGMLLFIVNDMVGTYDLLNLEKKKKEKCLVYLKKNNYYIYNSSFL